jgi:hypothetical protein
MDIKMVRKSEELELIEAQKEREIVEGELMLMNDFDKNHVESAMPDDKEKLLEQTQANLAKSMWYISERVAKRQRVLNKLNTQINKAFEFEAEIQESKFENAIETNGGKTQEARRTLRNRDIKGVLVKMKTVREYGDLDKGYLDVLYRYCASNGSSQEGLEAVRKLFTKK